MKKLNLIITLMMCLFSFISYSQTFNGVDVGNSLKQTEIDLKTKGFVFNKLIDNDIREYKGTVGSDKVGILLLTTKTSKIVWKISVDIDRTTSWTSAKSSFNKYLSVLENKYGSPSDNYTFFEKPYYDGGGDELNALYNNKCNYVAFWFDLNKNTIILELTSFEKGVVNTIVSYENKKASELKEKEEAADKLK